MTCRYETGTVMPAWTVPPARSGTVYALNTVFFGSIAAMLVALLVVVMTGVPVAVAVTVVTVVVVLGVPVQDWPVMVLKAKPGMHPGMADATAAPLVHGWPVVVLKFAPGKQPGTDDAAGACVVAARAAAGRPKPRSVLRKSVSVSG